MKIENYKGIDILHDAKKDEFYTNIVIRKGNYGKKDELMVRPRLQMMRDEIDKFLNVSAKKPVLKKAWMKGKYDDANYVLVDIILRNVISNTTEVRDKEGKTYIIKHDSYNSEKLFLSCKENDSIVAKYNVVQKEIEKLKKSISCSTGKLIPLMPSHFN